MPAIIAIGAMYGLTGAAAAGAGIATVAAGAKVATDLYSAHKQGAAAEHAADLSARGNADALTFEKQQADLAQANFEATQKANYEQWAAKEQRLSTIGQMAGLPARSVPGYVPTTSANGMTAGAAAQRFLAAVNQSGLDPVAVQGHGQTIADAVNQIDPSLQLSVDPKSDAIVWNGIPIDVTVNSGKGGWSFRPAGPSASAPIGAGGYAPEAPQVQTLGAMSGAAPRLLAAAPATPDLPEYRAGTLGALYSQPRRM
jgi:hypothetical protein